MANFILKVIFFVPIAVNDWMHRVLCRFTVNQYGRAYFALYYDILDAISGCKLKEERLKQLFSYTRKGSNTY